MDTSLVAGYVLCAAGTAQAVLMLVHAWEHRRYHRSRLHADLKLATPPRVSLFVPCKGMDVDLEANLRALFLQRYGPLELCFLIESESDPAAHVVRHLQQRFPDVACRVVFTGTAQDCGQKVHNLIRGTTSIPRETEVLAFVDSDACPHPDWLARLVARLQTGKSAVSTGYRWYVPVQPTLANRLLSAINNTVVAVMGPHGFNLVWGGAWAIRANVFREIGLPQAWHGTLSDDLVASRLIHAARLKVAYEPHALVRSSADFSWKGLAEFLRRQYIVVRVYAPTWWRFAVVSNGMTNLIVWGLLGLSLAWSVTGRAWGLPVVALLGCYLLTALRASVAARAVRPFVEVTNEQYRSVSRINIWAWPVIALLVGLGLVASAVSRTITWRGIRYRLDSPNQTTILKRPLSDGHNQAGSTIAKKSARAA